MGIKFFGGPYDGRETEYTEIDRCATFLPVSGDVGLRFFVLMPPPESWDRLLHGEKADTNPLYSYERVFTPEGPRFEWSPAGLEQAVLEAKLKVNQRAATALSAISDDTRRSVIRTIAQLQRTPADSWPRQKANRITADKPIYLVQLPGTLRAFVRILETGEIELFDIIQEDTLRLFKERYATVGNAG